MDGQTRPHHRNFDASKRQPLDGKVLFTDVPGIQRHVQHYGSSHPIPDEVNSSGELD
jgi:hypothetical protein